MVLPDIAPIILHFCMLFCQCDVLFRSSRLSWEPSKNRQGTLLTMTWAYFQEYVIRTQRGPLPDKSWRVCRRYNDFVQLHQALSASGINLPLPPKRIIGNMEPDFIAQRQAALQVTL